MTVTVGIVQMCLMLFASNLIGSLTVLALSKLEKKPEKQNSLFDR